MKCDATKCTNMDSKNFIALGKTKVHKECMTDVNWLQKAGEIYLKFYNDKESWPIMMRSLTSWNKVHEAEYICFAMSKAVKNNEKMKNFYSVYYIINNLNYIKMYEAYKNPKTIMTFENVMLDKFEYEILISYMGNLKKLEYYIKKLNDYIIKTGKHYDSHFETLKQWYNKEEESKPVKPKNRII